MLNNHLLPNLYIPFQTITDDILTNQIKPTMPTINRPKSLNYILTLGVMAPSYQVRIITHSCNQPLMQ
jgi:hypothetical protein